MADDTQVNSLFKDIIEWGGRQFFGLTRIVSNLFSTSKNVKAERIEITSQGIRGYDNYGNLIFFYSNDVNNKDPGGPTVTLGSGLFVSLLSSITTNLTMQNKSSKAKIQLRDTDNGQLLVTLDNASGNCQLSLGVSGLDITTDGLTMSFRDNFLTLTSSGIALDDTRRIGSGGCYARFLDGSDILGVYIDGALAHSLAGTEYKPSSGVTVNLASNSNPFIPRYAAAAGASIPSMADGEVMLFKDTDTGIYYLMVYKDGSYRSSELLT